MIHVEKPGAPVRLKRGVQITQQNRRKYNANIADYRSGSKTFEFDPNIYGHPSVREMLKDAQHGKCCFCEGRFDAHAAGDVEHYRPKGAVRQDKASTTVRPGYYWLAYSWENLYWCCQVCNRSNKREFFPLKFPAKRALSHKDNLAQEEPLIIDPGGKEDPRAHITFQQDRAVGSTALGRTTIKVIGLNRANLVEARLERLGEIKRLVEILEVWESDRSPGLEKVAKSALRELGRSIAPESVFSAMAMDYLSAL